MKTFNFGGNEIVADETCILYMKTCRLPDTENRYGIFIKVGNIKPDAFEFFKTDKARSKRHDQIMKETNCTGLKWQLFGEPK
jgi:hypothetical protein